MKINRILSFLIISLLLFQCKEDEEPLEALIGAFQQNDYSLALGESSTTLVISFTRNTNEATSVTIDVTEEGGMEYGIDKDYITDPAVENGTITVDIPANTNEFSIAFTKQKEPAFGQEKKVTFTLSSITDPLGELAGITETSVLFAENPISSGASLNANVGGPDQPNQVFIDLSRQQSTEVVRSSWDIGLYAGADDFKVILNPGNWASAIELDESDLSLVSEDDTVGLINELIVGSFAPGSDAYIDAPNGDLTKTAFGEIASSEEEAKVFILDRGYDSSRPPEVPRGWMKIKVFQSGSGYKVIYGNLNDDQFTTLEINKSANFNFNFVDLGSGTEVNAQPASNEWEIMFSPAPGILNFGGLVTYPFTNFVFTNRLNNTEVYAIDRRVVDDEGNPITDEEGNNVIDDNAISYEDFVANDIDGAKFSIDSDIIGSTWRSVFPPAHHFEFIYYIISDGDGNQYKLRFTAFANEEGDSGHPVFEYELIE